MSGIGPVDTSLSEGAAGMETGSDGTQSQSTGPTVTPAVSPLVLAAAQKWLSNGGTRGKPCTMAPWDEASHFQTVRFRSVQVLPGQPLVIPADPTRVALVLWTNEISGTTGAEWIPDCNLPNGDNGGLGIVISSAPWTILQSQTGPLCQLQWTARATAAAGANVVAIEVCLKDFGTP